MSKAQKTIECIYYFPVDGSIDVAKLVATFPPYIQEKLFYKSKKEMESGVSITALCKDHDVVDFLDRVLNIRRHKFDKIYQIVITKELIDNYPFYSIQPQQLNWPEDIAVDIVRSQACSQACEYGCHIGHTLIPPIVIKKKKKIKSDFLSTSFLADPSITLLLSQELCDRLQDNGIKGFEYHERCKTAGSELSSYRRVTIKHQIFANASAVVIQRKCSHDVAIHAEYFDCFVDEDQIKDYDVYSEIGVKTKTLFGTKTYFHRRPGWGISARLLKMLLELPRDKIHLCPRTYFRGECFEPVVTKQIKQALDAKSGDRQRRHGDGKLPL